MRDYSIDNLVESRGDFRTEPHIVVREMYRAADGETSRWWYLQAYLRLEVRRSKGIGLRNDKA